VQSRNDHQDQKYDSHPAVNPGKTEQGYRRGGVSSVSKHRQEQKDCRQKIQSIADISISSSGKRLLLLLCGRYDLFRADQFIDRDGKIAGYLF
ncbi:MAG: hypothetical protein II433_00305, partial [Acidaminococcaceae bacterium]|nr:hypothetical protein [Acidaminococcaceae bacterium]